MEFDPTKQLQQARTEQPLLDAALIRADKEKESFIAPIFSHLARLDEEIREMPIASRFSTEHGPDEIYNGPTTISPRELTAAKYKRAQLLIDLGTIRHRAMALANDVERLVMDMQATKQE